MSNEGVAIQIGYYPGDELVKPNSKGGYYYESDGGGRVSITVEDYPIKYGPYLKLTHSVEDGNIGSITHNSVLQNGITGLGGHKSVSVYYWSQDHACSKPLIIQLDDSEKYYKNDHGTTWNEDKEVHGTLRERLNKQNCGKNEAHIVKITEKSAYSCSGCSDQIKVSPNSMSTYIYSKHYIGYAQLISVTSFRDNSNDQVGLPLVKGVSTIYVYFDSKVNGTPLLIHYNKGERKWYMRNTKDSHTWSEVPRDERPKDPDDDSDNKIKKLLGKGSYHPEITLDLSNPGNYSDESTGISITVRATSVYGGYSKFEHSLRGGTFKVKSVVHGGNTLNGITSSTPVNSVSFFYWSEDSSYANPLLVQLGENTYYSWSSGNDWGPDSSSDLIRKLDKQNCRRNSAHVANISHHTTTSYNCYACSGQSINTVSSDESGGKYKKVVHTISSAGNDKIGRVDDGHPPQYGIKITASITSLTTFNYPKANNKALIIHVGSGWFKRKRKDGDEWVSAEEDKLDGDDSSNILPLLKSINGDKEGLSEEVKKGLEIGGGVLGGLATVGTIVGLVKKFWSTIVTTLITSV
ncbi:hypothetical protein BEWA_054110 [Theileria equi strain WA]|uniref:Uncharacterized protein n=1 Tax=Theileria equi strain WA TaxID=1537102 RepID=L1LDN3_THEEQ|nr:hypothetical protein BEWA_054110 [Theileria equi strain WA]EKX73355.1 hypothetical protein BEWA_054110 [Theileria equi strain WA]|eukprot:XP_004832807.1 hypothetical protein BEWA_054110 [Theileria equi strain WA]